MITSDYSFGLDREGEAIAAHLMKLLKLKEETTERITFNQISEKALKEALENSGRLNKNLYHAQQARAVIDIVFGFMVSPFMSRHLGVHALSAGRCQSPAVRLCMERQKEQCVGEVYVHIFGTGENLPKVVHVKPKLHTSDDIVAWLEYVKHQDFVVSKITKQEKKENPPPPFITSSLQQSAYNKHGFTPKTTMKLAQTLYETGYITYMRTDSVIVSAQFQNSASKWIEDTYGKEYVTCRQYGKRNGVKTQDAHEAIRPIDIYKSKPSDPLEAKLYDLIRIRAIASQMSAAMYDEYKLILETKKVV